MDKKILSAAIIAALAAPVAAVADTTLYGIVAHVRRRARR
jgi:hypothetical protein